MANTSESDAERRDPTLAFLAAWILPGLGHLLLGKPRKALFFFVSLSGLYALGYLLADFRFVRFEDNQFYHVGRWGSGLTWAATWLVEKNPPRGVIPMEHYEIGLLYMCSAGLLNVVLMLNLLGAPPAVRPATRGDGTVDAGPGPADGIPPAAQP
ncbi:MAG: hypothetical protein HUU15_07220 [Candidatus Brocadiae bacterium]|nr:hypothetical protein [Candidatus Brocadiia bacterium]